MSIYLFEIGTFVRTKLQEKLMNVFCFIMTEFVVLKLLPYPVLLSTTQQQCISFFLGAFFAMKG